MPTATLLEEADGPLRERLERIATHSPTSGRYEVRGEIGQGGMGRVLRVWDAVLQRELAMKVVSLQPSANASEEERAAHRRQLFRFVEEARITGQLDHPGIVPVHEIALDDGGLVYFTMPLVRGRNLGHVFELVRRSDEGWNLHRALGVIHKVCQTVAFAHSRGIVHRDLKPENILVGPFGEAYVVDWGLALIVGQRERRAMIGTPAYMSPEQAQGRQEQVGPRSDVYSLGAILYELLGGRVPHQLSMEQEAAVMARVIEHPPRSVGALAPDAPAELVAVCDKAMAHDPDDRYPTVQDMASDLEAWMEGRVVRAHDSSTWARVRKWSQRNRGLSFALESLAALVVVSVVGFVLLQQRSLRLVNAQRITALRNGYAASISAADLGLRVHETNEAKRQLLACEPELRGWEWRHLMLASDTSAAILRGHAGEVRSVDASPDGRWIATASDDGTMRLWDANTGQVERVFEGHHDVVCVVRFSPDGTMLASASQDKTVRLWDVASGTVLRQHAGHASRVGALAFNADGSLLASGSTDGTIIVWPLAPEGAGRELSTGDRVSALTFDPATGRLASGHSLGLVRLWDLDAGAELREEKIGEGQVLGLALDPGGTRLAAAVDRLVLLMDPESLAITGRLEEHAGIVSCVAFDSTGTRLLSGSFDNTVRMWDAASGGLLGSFVGHDQDVNAVVFLPGGSRFASGSEDDTARLWNTGARSVLTLEGHDRWVTSLAFRADGRRLITGSRDRTMRVWDAGTGELIDTIPAPDEVDCVAYGRGDHIAFGCNDGMLRAGVAEPGTRWTEMAGRAGDLRSVLFTPSGLAVARDWQSIQVWNLEEGRALVVVDEPEDQSGTLAIDPSGRTFAAGFETGAVRVHDVEDGRVVATFQNRGSPISALAYDNAGDLLAVGAVDRSIVLWDVETGERLKRLDGHENVVTSIAFSPDDTRMASGSVDDTVRVWNPVTGDALLTLRGHAQGVTAVAFSPDGSDIASSSKDGTVRLWRSTPAPPR